MSNVQPEPSVLEYIRKKLIVFLAGSVQPLIDFVQSQIDAIVAGGGFTSAAGIASAGTNQATATALTKVYNRVDTVTAGQGVKLPAAVLNTRYTVQNKGAGDDLLVYPASGDKFLDETVNAPETVAGGNQITVICYVAGEWTLV